MGEDVYLLSKSGPILTTDDDAQRHETGATSSEIVSSYDTTPKMETSRKAPKIPISVNDSDRTTTQENRLKSISTILSSLFGGMDDNMPGETTNKSTTRLRQQSKKGIYRFKFFQQDFSTEV